MWTRCSGPSRSTATSTISANPERRARRAWRWRWRRCCWRLPAAGALSGAAGFLRFPSRPRPRRWWRNPSPGGTLRVALGPTTEGLNPLTNQDRDTRNVLELVYEPLVELDEAQQPAPCLAESWSADAENHTVTFALRQG